MLYFKIFNDFYLGKFTGAILPTLCLSFVSHYFEISEDCYYYIISYSLYTLKSIIKHVPMIYVIEALT